MRLMVVFPPKSVGHQPAPCRVTSRRQVPALPSDRRSAREGRSVRPLPLSEKTRQLTKNGSGPRGISGPVFLATRSIWSDPSVRINEGSRQNLTCRKAPAGLQACRGKMFDPAHASRNQFAHGQRSIKRTISHVSESPAASPFHEQKTGIRRATSDFTPTP